MIVAAVYTVKLMPHHLLRFVVMLVVRSVYKVRSINHAQLPAKGGVLLLANHVSYVDALILGAACERQVRFVMWDVLYNVWWMRWFLRIVGTVPISATRAKDAIRSVASALKEGQIVCLFPEWVIAQTGITASFFGGTSLLIVVNVTVDTITQIQSHLLAHQYGDLIKKAKLKGRLR